MALLSVDDALERLLADVAPLDAEMVPLVDADGRTLAADLVARHAHPAFDASAMDGYAVRAADVSRLPAPLAVIGEAAAGQAFEGPIGPGEAVRIFTGAMVPAGADLIAIQEDTTRSGATVEVQTLESGTTYIRRQGSDFNAGDRLLTAGSRLSARTLMLAAAMGHGSVPVVRRPRVALVATGDELVLPGEQRGRDQTICSNPFGISPLVRSAGGSPLFRGIARDDRDALRRELEAALAGSDVVVTIGGASVGDHDLVGPVLSDMGATIDFWKVAMRPGKPLMLARLGEARILGLPGNPVSALVCSRVFLMPLIARLAGRPGSEMAAHPALLTRSLEANGPRLHYMRATLERDGGTFQVTPAASQDSALIRTLATANAFIVRHPGAEAAEAGSAVDVLPIDF